MQGIGGGAGSQSLVEWLIRPNQEVGGWRDWRRPSGAASGAQEALQADGLADCYLTRHQGASGCEGGGRNIRAVTGTTHTHASLETRVWRSGR